MLIYQRVETFNIVIIQISRDFLNSFTCRTTFIITTLMLL